MRSLPLEQQRNDQVFFVAQMAREHCAEFLGLLNVDFRGMLPRGFVLTDHICGRQQLAEHPESYVHVLPEPRVIVRERVEAGGEPWARGLEAPESNERWTSSQNSTAGAGSLRHVSRG